MSYDEWKTRAPEDEPGYWDSQTPECGDYFWDHQCLNCGKHESVCAACQLCDKCHQESQSTEDSDPMMLDNSLLKDTQCADCFKWVDYDEPHTCRQQKAVNRKRARA